MSDPGNTHVPGPFFLDDFGDYFYVVSESGVRMAMVDHGENVREKAEQICAALNAMHHIARAIGGGNV